MKDVIDYARNPDKTFDPKCLDDDLQKALRYVANDEKTDRALFVDTINCPKKRAHEQMMATKRRFGKIGGNVAYHGYQSFVKGEVTPEEVHAIGMETARRMWGDAYEMIVTTHMNTDNLHNHMVVNSVSFRTGKKFANHIADHYRLREISDAVCIEHGKSILKNKTLYGGGKGAYWTHKKGGLTHRDILKRDVESVLRYSKDAEDFRRRLKALGYQFMRGDDKHRHLSIKAADWQRPIRLDGLGYTREMINARFDRNRKDEFFLIERSRHPAFKPQRYPLLELEKQLSWEIDHSSDTAIVMVDVMFFILLQLLMLINDREAQAQRCQPLSPSIRMEIAKLHHVKREYHLLADNNIHSAQELLYFADDIAGQIKSMESERRKYRNLLRRPKTQEIENAYKRNCKDLSDRILPLREKLRIAKRVIERYPKIYDLLLTEHQMEKDALSINRERGYIR